MDEDNYLVLINGKDKTPDIQSYKITDSTVKVIYRSSTRIYTYARESVVVMTNPVVSKISDDKIVYRNGMPLRNVTSILKFESKVRVRFSMGGSQVYDANMIRVEENSINTSSAKKILDYLKNLSEFTYVRDDEGAHRSFLKSQFEKLTVVSSQSVLGVYLNRQQIHIESDVHDTIFPFKFNLSQKEAVHKALSSQISIIEGPPGTGKTQTILNIIANLAVLQNKKVAVVSSNNAAVQNVRDKLQTEGYDFLVALLGNSGNKKNFFSNPPQPHVSGWRSDIGEADLRTRVKELNTQIQDLMEAEREMAQLQNQLSTLRLEKEHFETYFARQNIAQARKLSFYRLTSRKILSFLIHTRIAVEQGTTGGIFHRLKSIIQYGFTDFRRLKDAGSDVILSFQRKYYEVRMGELTRKIETLQTQLDKGSFNELIALHYETSRALMRHKLHQKFRDHKSDQINVYSYKKNFAKFIERFPIMLSTTHSLRTCIPDNFLFDYVIIDESSQVDLLTGALALSCGKRAIIVGDTKQLPHIVNSNTLPKLRTDARVDGPFNYFKHNLLSSVLEAYGDAVPRVLLKEHYRCHPRIIEFCNQKYYNGQLIAFTKEEENDRPLLIYRTAPGNHMREITHGVKGKFNQRELDVIQQEVLVDLAAAAERYTDIGFTTPYRKQVQKAASQLANIEIDTIHKYQGREKKTMILCTVLDSSLSGKTGMRFVNDPCLINVAVSRAQKQFILVTDHRLFREYGSEIGDLIRYMDYSTLDDNVIESEIVSVFDLLYKEYSNKLRVFRSTLSKRSKFASENIIWTLLNEILKEEAYSGLACRDQVFIRNLLNDVRKLDDQALRYVNNGASVDFVIYRRFNNAPIMAIEVDGTAFHENSPQQLERDRLKDRIFQTYRLPLLRLPTTGSGEGRMIRTMLDQILRN